MGALIGEFFANKQNLELYYSLKILRAQNFEDFDVFWATLKNFMLEFCKKSRTKEW